MHKAQITIDWLSEVRTAGAQAPLAPAAAPPFSYPCGSHCCHVRTIETPDGRNRTEPDRTSGRSAGVARAPGGPHSQRAIGWATLLGRTGIHMPKVCRLRGTGRARPRRRRATASSSASEKARKAQLPGLFNYNTWTPAAGPGPGLLVFSSLPPHSIQSHEEEEARKGFIFLSSYYYILYKKEKKNKSRKPWY